MQQPLWISWLFCAFWIKTSWLSLQSVAAFHYLLFFSFQWSETNIFWGRLHRLETANYGKSDTKLILTKTVSKHHGSCGCRIPKIYLIRLKFRWALLRLWSHRGFIVSPAALFEYLCILCQAKISSHSPHWTKCIIGGLKSSYLNLFSVYPTCSVCQRNMQVNLWALQFTFQMILNA